MKNYHDTPNRPPVRQTKPPVTQPKSSESANLVRILPNCRPERYIPMSVHGANSPGHPAVNSWICVVAQWPPRDRPEGEREWPSTLVLGQVHSRSQSRQGRKNRCGVRTSVVPSGTFRYATVAPSAKALGYCRSSLRDGQWPARSTTFSRPSASMAVPSSGWCYRGRPRR